MTFPDELKTHLQGGFTSICWCWKVTRRDGRVFGFTEHDVDLEFESTVFRADTGLSAKALHQTSGLSVDNSEAVGALSDAAVTEADIRAGRFDGAWVRAWLVNWADPDQRVLMFNGSFGEIGRGDGAFTAELRGLTENLNQPQGRVYQKSCAAVLGDDECRFDTGTLGYVTEVALSAIEDDVVLHFPTLPGFEEHWFESGRLLVLDGPSEGLVGQVKIDLIADGARRIELWTALGRSPAAGDMVRLEAGCDRRPETCRLKFNNFLNFRGFPHIPGEDWLLSYPTASGENTGGSLSG